MPDIDPLRQFYQFYQISPPTRLFETLSDTYYFAKNCKGEFVYLNSLLTSLFALEDPSSVIGKTDFDFFRNDIANEIRADDLRVIYEGQEIHNKLEVVEGKDGELLWLFTSKVALRDKTGRVIGVEGFSRDAQKSQSSIEPYNEFRASIEYLRKHFSGEVTVTGLAQMACMSVSSFERKFKRHFGCTPSHYIRRYRVQQACTRLSAGMSIQRTAQDCGFCDQSYFTKTFRSQMGVTPKQYQSQYA